MHHDIFKPILFGGDQLTAARAMGSQQIWVNSETASEGLHGLIPVAEDWHTSVTLITVSKCNSESLHSVTVHTCRLILNASINIHPWIMEHYINYATSLFDVML